eukprot:SAG31_NODE_12512_length_936_cov_1.074074_2_plen_68_part_01
MPPSMQYYFQPTTELKTQQQKKKHVDVSSDGCAQGWAGEDCDECAPGYSGDMCDQKEGGAGAAASAGS